MSPPLTACSAGATPYLNHADYFKRLNIVHEVNLLMCAVCAKGHIQMTSQRPWCKNGFSFTLTHTHTHTHT